MLTRFLHYLRGRRLPYELSYERARDALGADEAQRLELAERKDAKPEILYYLAGDPLPEVRRRVAGNAATPRQADRLLVDDPDTEVRCALARKIARLLPDLPDDTAEKLRELTIEVLEALARDQLPRVRAIIAEEICRSRRVPEHIVQALARDVEAMVAAPVLQYSPLLSDDDLKEIIASGCAQGALEAIARREGVNEGVSDAIVATVDVPAIAALLANPNAQIREETLDRLVEDAESITAWHRPLVMRPGLSVRALRRIATFVAVSLLDTLAERHDLDKATMDEIRLRVRTRIESSDSVDGEPDARERARAEIERAVAAGELDDSYVADAAEAGDGALVCEALAYLTTVPLETVERVVASHVAKAVTALAWAAGLSMRAAVKIQVGVARLPPAEVLHAKHGTEYPVGPEEMGWHLECFGILVNRAKAQG